MWHRLTSPARRFFSFERASHMMDALKPERDLKHVMSLLLATVAINVLSLALPVMTLQVYDRILPNEGSGTLNVLMTGVCIAVILELFLRLSRAYMTGLSGAVYEHRMACQILGRTLNANLSRMPAHGVGEHLHYMSSVSKLKEFYNGYALTIITELLFVPLALAVILYVSGWLVLVPVAILVLFLTLSLFNGMSLRQALQQREAKDDKRFNFLVETLEGIHTIKALALEKYFERRYEALEEASVLANYAVTQKTAATFNSGAICSHLMVASVITAGAWAVLSGTLTTGSLIATLLLSGRLMQPVQKALSLWARYQNFQLARNNAAKLMHMPQQVVNPRAHDELIVREGTLELVNVTFRYNRDATAVLKNCSLSLRRGKAVVISGEHGSGKSTLMKLIAGIYSACDGTIIIDGEDISTFSNEELSHHVGYIQSTPFIFRGTIRDNITSFGQIPERQAREVAALIGLDKDIALLPAGFDTFLNGNETDNIPHGLKQRIMIVRTLARKPKLILFDNADRSLDKEGYTAIYRLLARLKGKVSMILLTDDHNLRSLADQNYTLRDGALYQQGRAGIAEMVRPYKELVL